MLNIVVLDGFAENPGDLSWKGFEDIGDLTVYDRTPSELILARSCDADVVLTNKTPLSRETIFALPRLKYIGVLATGYNIVDISAAKERGIPVCNVPSYGTDSVAQTCFALILETYLSVGAHDADVKNGGWCRCPDYSYSLHTLRELSGKTIGFIGFGRIGQRAADIAQAFGMNILAYDIKPSDQSHRKNFAFVPLDELLSRSDIISLHCNLTPENTGMINKASIEKMKRSAIIVNTARGQLVCENDLIDALNSGRIAGAALDVICSEPPSFSDPIFSAKNIIITPHISWSAIEARKRLMDTAVENLRCFLSGNTINAVNL